MSVCMSVLMFYVLSQQFFSLVGKFSYLPGFNKYLQKISVLLNFSACLVFSGLPELKQRKTEDN